MVQLSKSFADTMRDAYFGAMEQDAKAMAMTNNSTSTSTSSNITGNDNPRVFLIPCKWMRAFLHSIQVKQHNIHELSKSKSDPNNPAADDDFHDSLDNDSESSVHVGKISNRPLVEDNFLGRQTSFRGAYTGTNTGPGTVTDASAEVGAAASTSASASADGRASASASESPLNKDERAARREKWTRKKEAEGKDDNPPSTEISASANNNQTNEQVMMHLKHGMAFNQNFTLVGNGLWTLLSNKFGYDLSVYFEVELKLDEIMNTDVNVNGNGEDVNMHMYMAGTESGLIGGDDANATAAASTKEGPGTLSGSEKKNNKTLQRKIVRVASEVLVVPDNGKFDYSNMQILADGHGHGHAYGAIASSDNGIDETRSSSGLISEDDSGRLAIGDADTSTFDNEDVPPLLLLPPSTTLPPTDISIGALGVGSDMILDTSNDGIGIGNSTPPVSDNDDDSLVMKNRKRKRYGAGLGNLGNTCFMNSTLQCLAHTGPLRSYFLSGEYEGDLNKDNPLGTGGELATEFANLLMEMWGTASPSSSSNNSSSLYASKYSGYRKTSWNSSSNSTTAVYPRNFKYTLGKHAEQFMGYNQHDSQELATYLLDALHEDTNRVSKKPYIEKPEQKIGQSDEEAAHEAWALHLKREDSRVLESFMGQVKSRVECPNSICGRVSTTFDPFMYLSVPLPGTTETTIEVTFVSSSPDEMMKKIDVTLAKTATIKDLRMQCAELLNKSDRRTEVVASDLAIAEVFHKEVFQIYKCSDEVAKIKEADEIFAFEVASVESIHVDQEKESESNQTEDENEGRHVHVSRLKPDLATLTRLNKDWELVLGSYLSQVSTLPSLLNPKRNTHHDRMLFHKKLTNFLKRCYQTSECKGALDAAEIGSEADPSGEMSPTTTIESKLGATLVDDAQSLEELCATSSVFKNVNTALDVSCIEFCTNKFYQASVNMAKEKKLAFRDGALIQINIRKSGNSVLGGRADSPCALPIILRISPTLTVYGLRKILAERFSHVTSCGDNIVTTSQDAKEEKFSVEGSSPSADEQMDQESAGFLEGCSDSLRLLRQVPLLYERKSAYSSYTKPGSYRKLGSIPVAENTSIINHSLFAQPGDDDEKELVLEHVGKSGKVQVHFPTKESFDEVKWDLLESTNKNDDEAASKKDSISVLDCIRKYCQIEQLEATEMWYCNKCKEHVRAWKQFHLYRAPPILIIHLKRFHYSPLTHRRDKIDLMVDFPLKSLDLTNEVTHWSQSGEDKPIYDCYAVSNHFGGLGGGHYTAYALNDQGDWCNFDDSRVTKNVDESEITSTAAYVLYYRRRDVTVDDEAWADRPMPTSSDVPSTVSSIGSSTGQMEIEEESNRDCTETDDMLTNSTPPGSIADVTDIVEDEEMDIAPGMGLI